MWKRQWIVSVAWLAAVSWYWRSYVPLVPTRSVPISHDSSVVGFRPDGSVVISRVVRDRSRGYIDHYGGPVSVWRLPDLVKVSERLGYGDEIAITSLDPVGQLAVVGQGSIRRIVDLWTGVTLEDVPHDVHEVIFSRTSERRVLYLRPASVTLRDLAKSRDVWTVKGLHARGGGFQRDLVVLHNALRFKSGHILPAAPTSVCLLLNAATGEADTRFDHLGKFDEVMFSNDDRWALVRNRQGNSQLCDAKTGRTLWPLTVPFQRWPRFDPAGEELVLDWATPGGELRQSRWRCSDGAALTEPPEHFHWADRDVDHTGRFAVDMTDRRGPFELFAQQVLNPLLNGVGSSKQFPSYRTIQVLRDLSTGSVVGPLPGDGHVTIIPGQSAGIAVRNRHIELYEFPARRNWSWLAGVGLTPVAIAALGRLAWRRIRGRVARPQGQVSSEASAARSA